ncbi:MAG: preprotein translocase subunit SecG [Elusimicrobia bacterium]|nr:preprotein translocase subunit SecG [Elusimicrobiota bacterium]
MMAIIIGIHVVVCFLLICMILVQSGRGGGLIESFSGMESVFGTKTSSFMTKLTSILSVIFLLTCLTLALLSVRQSRSLMSGVKPAPAAAGAKTEPAAASPGQAQEIPSAPDTSAAQVEANGPQKATP